jgi:hypothetical protein
VAAAVLEPISPELELVCPELRQQALAALPEVEWWSFVDRGQSQIPRVADEPRTWAPAIRQTTLDAVHILGFYLAALLSTAGLTLALTIVANATR